MLPVRLFNQVDIDGWVDGYFKFSIVFDRSPLIWTRFGKSAESYLRTHTEGCYDFYSDANE